MEDPANILRILEEAERSLAAAKAAYAAKDSLCMMQNLIVSSAAVASTLAIVALGTSAPSTQINVPDRRLDGKAN